MLDGIGIFDPTGLADATNSILYASQGRWGYAMISIASIIPYAGDLAKGSHRGQTELQINTRGQTELPLV